MSNAPTYSTSYSRAALMVMMLALFLASPSYLSAADASVKVQLDSKNAGPRAVESLTEQGILRDYRMAWTSMAQALEFNRLDPLDGPFTGDAKRILRDTIASQQKTGIRQRYIDQNHRLEVVFYAPEGDVIELHDTAEYRLQVVDGEKLIQNEHVVLHYIVLMTPSADRWMVRQLQSAPQF